MFSASLSRICFVLPTTMQLALLLSILASLVSLLRAFSHECEMTPGVAPYEYSGGSFETPNEDTLSFSEGETMNICWTSVYSISTVWVLTGCDFGNTYSIIVLGALDGCWEWNVSTHSTNQSQVYQILVSNTTDHDVESGIEGVTDAFISSSFYIDGSADSDSSYSDFKGHWDSSSSSSSFSGSLSSFVRAASLSIRSTSSTSSPTSSKSNSTSAAPTTSSYTSTPSGPHSSILVWV